MDPPASTHLIVDSSQDMDSNDGMDIAPGPISSLLPAATDSQAFKSVVVDADFVRQVFLAGEGLTGSTVPQDAAGASSEATPGQNAPAESVSTESSVSYSKPKKKKKKNQPKSVQPPVSAEGALEGSAMEVSQTVEGPPQLSLKQQNTCPMSTQLSSGTGACASPRTERDAETVGSPVSESVQIKKKKKAKRPKSAQHSVSSDLAASSTSPPVCATDVVVKLSESVEKMDIAEGNVPIAGGGMQSLKKKKPKKKNKKESQVLDVNAKEEDGKEKQTVADERKPLPLPEKIIQIQQQLLERQKQQQQHHNHPRNSYNILHNHYPHFPHPHHGHQQGHTCQGDHATQHQGNRQHGHQQGPQGQGQEGHTPQGHRSQSGQHSGKKEQHKKNIFEPYWPMEKVSEGLKRGTLFEGRIRINPKNYEDAYVPLPDGSADVYICGLPVRNRALNGDIVAVLVGDMDDWRVYTEEVTYYEKNNASTGSPKEANEPPTNCQADGSADKQNPEQDDEHNVTAATAPEDVHDTQLPPEDPQTAERKSWNAENSEAGEDRNEDTARCAEKMDTTEIPANTIGEVAQDGNREETEIKEDTGKERVKKANIDAEGEKVEDEGRVDKEEDEADVLVEEEEEVELDSEGNPILGTQVIRPGCGAVAGPSIPASPSIQTHTQSGRTQSGARLKDAKYQHEDGRGGKNTDHKPSSAGGSQSGNGTLGSPAKKRFMSVKEVRETGSPVAKRLFGSPSSERAEGEESQEVPMDRFMQRTGKVVAIIDRKHSRAASGNLRPMQNSKMSFAIFAPTDCRIPRIMIHTSELPEGFKERPEDFSKVLFIARITDWNETSNMPRGSLARSLGEAGQVEPETEALLMENNVDFSEFSDEVLACLPHNLPWSISQEELDWRRDLRKECIFTIDPVTARDLDDALHCNYLGDGVYEVGVHIADVSYFVKEGTALDEVASSRATSVYLVQKVIPMLPRLLCEQLCSLNPDEDRLTFSVIWKMTEKGEILEEWFGRSVIRSCVKLSYDHAQGFIEEPDRQWTTEELPPISKGFTVDDIKTKVLQMDNIAKAMREARFDGGALRLDQVKIQYTLNKETGMPNGYSVYEQRDSNKLVEEFMLLANMAVAHKIRTAFKGKAVLRRHPPPQSKMIDDLKALCDSLSVPIEVSSAKEIQMSLSRYMGEDELSRSRLQVLVVLCSKPMQNARYFCCGVLADETMYRHYALNVPLYTHFTSPIRRYPDILVHRTLAASLEYCSVTSRSSGELQKIADVCNEKKANAKICSDKSNDIYFSIFVKEAGPLEEKGMVMAVLDKSFDVYVLKLGVVKRVYCEKLPLIRFTHHKEGKRPELTLVWNADDGCPRLVTQKLSIFSCVNCVLQSEPEPLRWSATIRRPQENDPTAGN